MNLLMRICLHLTLITPLAAVTALGSMPAARAEVASGGNQNQPAISEPEEFGGLDLTQLADIRIVTATRHSTSLRKAPAIATVISADEIRNMGARNLLDVLRMVPGIGIAIGENGVNIFEVRGIRTQNAEKILFMIDGHSLNKNLFGSALYILADMLPVENIKQVEVVRGPGSALYGNSAFLSTVNVITRDADEIDGLETKIGGGSFNTAKGNMVGGKKYGDNLAASGSFDYYRTDGPNVRIEADTIRNTPWSMAPGPADESVRQIDAFLKVLYGDLSLRGHYLTTRKGRYIGPAFALTDDDYADEENYWAELAYGRQIAEQLSANMKLSYDHYKQDPHYKLFPNGFAGSFPSGVVGKSLAQDQTFSVELQVDWEPFKGDHLIVGAAYEYFQQYGVRQLSNFDQITHVYIGPLQEVQSFNRDADRHTFGLYLQDEWQVSKELTLTAGVRYDHFSDFGDTINPRAALVWNVLENIDAKLLYGRAFRAPNFTELYATTTNAYAVGNPDLRPERIETWEAGITCRPARFLTFDLNYFHSAIDDQIARQGSAPAHYANIGESVTQGVEFGMGGSVFRNLQWKATYTYQDPRNGITGRRLPYVPSHRVTASLNYPLMRYLNLHTDLLWTGPRPRDLGDTRQVIPDYATVDLAVTARNFWKGLEVQLAVHNLFDQGYKDPDTSGAANSIPGDFPREGVSVFANVLYKF